MIINHNMQAINSHRQLGINQSAGSKAMEKLSSGLRINRAADDAAGLSISEKMRSQIRGLQQASRNSQDGVSLIQTAEGALNEVNAMLVRIRELATQAANGTYDQESDLSRINEELTELKAQIKDQVDNTKFNGINLLNGSGGVTVGSGSGATQAIKLQIGIEASQVLELDVSKFNLSEVYDGIAGSGSGAFTGIKDLNLDSQANATAALGDIENLINKVSAARSYLGANQNRLEYTIKNLDIYAENLQASESRIRDTDMAKEMMEFTRTNILNQASTAMLAQANQTPQTVLQLLR